MINISNKKKNKTKGLIFTLMISFALGFIFSNYMLYCEKLDGLATKLTRLFTYNLIKTNVVKYEINYGEKL